MPPAWVWSIFWLSMLVLLASMLTWREGRRFASRPLADSEERVVLAAIQWQDACSRRQLADMLQQGRIRAMDRFTFARAEERNAFGYTDEHGRILLNPHLCFAYQRTLAPRLTPGIAGGDLVATLATLHHELNHLTEGSSEALAYEEEWRFVCRLGHRCSLNGRADLATEWLEWRQNLPSRVSRYGGVAAVDPIRLRVEAQP